MSIPVTAIFDIGKTNKKFYLFDRSLKEIHHTYQKFPEIADDDGYPCDNLGELTQWIHNTIDEIASSPKYSLEAINFSTYGATLVHLDEAKKPVTPLYNYLKPFPENLFKQFDRLYSLQKNDLETASPYLGMLNSALQLYWIKYDKPEVFRRIKYTLHFPQYLSYLFTGKLVSEPTSIGCHTKFWDFEKSAYHSWVRKESLTRLLPDVVPTTQTYEVSIKGKPVRVGVGIHDSSSALASYMLRSTEPFVLISTGTWSIVMNPYTTEGLTGEELKRDCLNYLTIEGKPVKASRLFLGHEFDHHLDLLNKRFEKDKNYYRYILADADFIKSVESGNVQTTFYPATIDNPTLVKEILGDNRWDVNLFSSFEEAYHQLMFGLVKLQVASLRLALGSSGVKKIYIDGGFIDNEVFISLLKATLPGFDIEVSRFPLGSAFGAARILH